ncbi:hypothetical protein J007_03886, partial [Cryptococcus neoformans]
TATTYGEIGGPPTSFTHPPNLPFNKQFSLLTPLLSSAKTSTFFTISLASCDLPSQASLLAVESLDIYLRDEFAIIIN